jgi:hypothetical protein
MPLLAVAATTMMDTSERLVHQDGSPGSGSGQSQVRKRERDVSPVPVLILIDYSDLKVLGS